VTLGQDFSQHFSFPVPDNHTFHTHLLSSPGTSATCPTASSGLSLNTTQNKFKGGVLLQGFLLFLRNSNPILTLDVPCSVSIVTMEHNLLLTVLIIHCTLFFVLHISSIFRASLGVNIDVPTQLFTVS
jgi:hypothetical protein